MPSGEPCVMLMKPADVQGRFTAMQHLRVGSGIRRGEAAVVRPRRGTWPIFFINGHLAEGGFDPFARPPEKTVATVLPG